jgi:hypothetical protein
MQQRGRAAPKEAVTKHGPHKGLKGTEALLRRGRLFVRGVFVELVFFLMGDFCSCGVENPGQVSSSEDVDHSLEVICHHRKADFGL